jgi:phage-related tail fiber protein
VPSTQVDRINGLTTSVAVKAPVRVVATTNIALSGLQTIDGVTLVLGDRVLCIAQTSSHTNGIYTASSGDWVRAADFDGPLDIVQGTLVVANSSSGFIYYRVTSANPIAIGTDAIEFESVGFGASQQTVGSAGGASALPATPSGYVFVQVSGNEYVVPYYAKA